MKVFKKFTSPLTAVAFLFVLFLSFATPFKALAQGGRTGETPRNQGNSAAFSEFSDKGVTSDLLQQANPLNITDTDGDLVTQFSTPGGILSRVLLFAFPIAGLILFVMITWGGFEMVMGSADKKAQDAGKQRITAAVIGFGLLFVSFWIIQIIETVLGIKIFF